MRGHVARTSNFRFLERLDELQDGSRKLFAICVHLSERLIIDKAHSVSPHDLTSHLSAGTFSDIEEVDKLLVSLALETFRNIIAYRTC